jgi:uncharacterized membrane protein
MSDRPPSSPQTATPEIPTPEIPTPETPTPETPTPETPTPQASPPRAAGALPFDDRVNAISSADPWLWLAAGWKDLCLSPALSLSIGAVFAGLGLGVTAGLYYLGVPYLIWPMTAGFIIIAPIFCTAFYAISRASGQGEKPGVSDIVRAWQQNFVGILGAGTALVFFMLIWVRVAALIYAVNFPHTTLSVRQIAVETLFTADGITFIAVGSSIGGVLAFFAFLVSAVSLQTIVDGKAGFVPAIFISVFSVVRNFLPMMVWAGVITLFTIAGFAVAYVGLIVTLPLIGHASWHAYKALVRTADVED